jgi:cellulose synthase/poly-beta-1,6-N-acetylglucosamine synthase-like glycosyltransferase
MSIAPCRDAREAVTKAQRANWVFPIPDEGLLVLDLVIVAYLPNEKDIIIDRINYACEKIVYPKHKIRINIVYNTPRTMEPLETDMTDLMQQFPHLRIHKVPNSTSKADNLNYFLTLDTGADVIAIYDSDHYAHPYGPRWAIERLMTDKKIDIVQGRCVVFNSRASLLSAIISVEFDKIYAVSHPGRATLWGFGLFTGSNGYWRAPLLKTLKMDGNMLTEDIDSSLRAFSKGCKAVHDLNVVSYELAPTTLPAFWKQRLRWAQGWAQASLKHVKHTWKKPQESPRSFTNRFGLLSLLVIREASYYLVTQYCCLVFSLICLNFPTSATAFFRVIFFTYPVSQWFFIIRYALPFPLAV